MRYKLFACEILFRELCFLASKSPHRIDLEFLPKGLHDVGREGMSRRLAETIATIDEDAYDAILLGYALCSGGIVGVRTRKIPLVLPRAHDCITLFLGSRQRYQDYFFENSGTFFKTTGWIERGGDLVQNVPESIAKTLGLDMSLDEMIEKYGEENARYLREQIFGMGFYSKLAFIETGIEPDDSFEKLTRQEATQKGWDYEKIPGNLNLLERLLAGDWSAEDFLVVPPGRSIELSYDDDIVRLA